MAILALNREGRLTVHCDYEDRKIPSEIGGVWDEDRNCWELPCTVAKVEHLLAKFKDVSITEGVETKVQQLIEREGKLERLREQAAQDVPVHLKVPGLKVPLYNYQRLGVMFGLTCLDGVLLADEMGLGKTIQAIAIALYRKARKQANNCLVIVPASLKYNWPAEIEKFTDEKYVVVDGTPEKRVGQWLDRHAFFTVVNYELVLEDLFGGRVYQTEEEEEDDTPEERERKRRKNERAEKSTARSQARMLRLASVRGRIWDMIIADEAHALRTHASKRSRNLKELRSRFRIALTGTPIDGKLEELHSVMGFVEPGLFVKKVRFLQRHAVYDHFGQRIVRYKRVNEVKEAIQPYFIRRLKKQVLKDLPDKVYQNVQVSLSKREQKIYDELAASAHELTEDADIRVVIVRCKQFCDHPNLVGIENCQGSKLEVFLTMLDELVIQGGHKVIVFSQYSEMTDILLVEMERMGLRCLYIHGGLTDKRARFEMQAKFNDDPNVDVMLGTDAMKEGLNLTGADYVINYDDAWSPSVMKQREDRSHRIGQEEVVHVINFICRNTVEARIREVLYNKETLTADILGDDVDEFTSRGLSPREIAKLL